MNIKKEARQFIRKYDLQRKGVTIQSLTNIALSVGYEVIYFNPNVQRHFELLKSFGEEMATPATRAIACEKDGKKIIFIIFYTSEQDKIFLLLHELAHIYLDHDYKSGITDTAKEIQANDFASYVIKHGNSKRLLPALIAGTVIATVFLTALSAVFIYKSILPKAEPSVLIQSPTPTETTQSTQEQTVIKGPEEPTPQQTLAVYITRTGKKYHRPDCYHISGKSTFSININEAISTGYEACKSCRPDNQ